MFSKCPLTKQFFTLTPIISSGRWEIGTIEGVQGDWHRRGISIFNSAPHLSYPVLNSPITYPLSNDGVSMFVYAIVSEMQPSVYRDETDFTEFLRSNPYTVIFRVT